MPVQRKSLIGKTAASNKTTSPSAEGSSLKTMSALSMKKKTARYLKKKGMTASAARYIDLKR